MSYITSFQNRFLKENTKLYLLFGFLSVAYIYAFITGFRLPNTWSMNYYLPSFFDGFVRRGFVGTVLFVFGDLRANYFFIAFIQFSIFFLLNFFIVRAVIKNKYFIVIYSLFLLSPLGGYFFHSIGYVDQLLYLLLFLLFKSSNRVLNALLLFCMLFIHEVTMFTIFPLYFGCRFFLGDRVKDLLPTFLVCLFGIGLLYFFFQTTPKDVIDVFLRGLEQKTNYPIRGDFFVLFTGHYDAQAFFRFSFFYYTEGDYRNIMLLSPLYLVVGYVFFKKGGSQLEKVFLFFIGIMIPFIPLAVGAVAWDCARWVFLSACSSLICLYIAREYVTLKISIVVSFIFVLFFMYGSLFYFDGYLPRTSSLANIVDFIQQGFIKEIINNPTH